MGFELREHTADVAVEARSADLSALFGDVADGLAAASCDDIPTVSEAVPTFEVSVAAENRQALLFDYLDQLIYERDVRGVLPVDSRAAVDPPADETGPRAAGVERGTEDGVDSDDSGGVDSDDGDSAGVHDDGDGEWSLTATYRGLPLDDVDAREVKAVTYSEMRVERTDDGWVAYVVFDV